MQEVGSLPGMNMEGAGGGLHKRTGSTSRQFFACRGGDEQKMRVPLARVWEQRSLGGLSSLVCARSAGSSPTEVWGEVYGKSTVAGRIVSQILIMIRE